MNPNTITCDACQDDFPVDFVTRGGICWNCDNSEAVHGEMP